MPSKTSTALRDSSLQRSHSYQHQVSATKRSPDSSSSDAHCLVQYPDVEGIGRFRAQVVQKQSKKGGATANPNMPQIASRKTESDTRTYTRRDAYTTASKGKQEYESEHRHRHRSSRSDSRNRAHPKDRREARSTEDVRLTRHDRSHREGRDISRRDPYRRPSLPKQRPPLPSRRDSVQLPIRR